MSPAARWPNVKLLPDHDDRGVQPVHQHLVRELGRLHPRELRGERDARRRRPTPASAISSARRSRVRQPGRVAARAHQLRGMRVERHEDGGQAPLATPLGPRARSAAGARGAHRRTRRRSPRCGPIPAARPPVPASAARREPTKPGHPAPRRPLPRARRPAAGSAGGGEHDDGPGHGAACRPSARGPGRPGRTRRRCRSGRPAGSGRPWPTSVGGGGVDVVARERDGDRLVEVERQPGRLGQLLEGARVLERERADPGAAQRREVPADAERRRRGRGPAPGRRCPTSTPRHVEVGHALAAAQARSARTPRR